MVDQRADVSAVEQIKQASRGLRGSLAPELAADTSHFEDEAAQLLKFHGVYQQDDRDARRQRGDAGLEPDYAFMVRCKIPGGVLTARQYLVLDELAGRYGNGTLRVTTRQDNQFHGVVKGDLKATIRELNDALVTTLGACGDVQRNVMCFPAPPPGGARFAGFSRGGGGGGGTPPRKESPPPAPGRPGGFGRPGGCTPGRGGGAGGGAGLGPPPRPPARAPQVFAGRSGPRLVPRAGGAAAGPRTAGAGARGGERRARSPGVAGSGGRPLVLRGVRRGRADPRYRGWAAPNRGATDRAAVRRRGSFHAAAERAADRHTRWTPVRARDGAGASRRALHGRHFDGAPLVHGLPGAPDVRPGARRVRACAARCDRRARARARAPGARGPATHRADDGLSQRPRASVHGGPGVRGPGGGQGHDLR